MSDWADRESREAIGWAGGYETNEQRRVRLAREQAARAQEQAEADERRRLKEEEEAAEAARAEAIAKAQEEEKKRERRKKRGREKKREEENERRRLKKQADAKKRADDKAAADAEAERIRQQEEADAMSAEGLGPAASPAAPPPPPPPAGEDIGDLDLSGIVPEDEIDVALNGLEDDIMSDEVLDEGGVGARPVAQYGDREQGDFADDDLRSPLGPDEDPVDALDVEAPLPTPLTQDQEASLDVTGEALGLTGEEIMAGGADEDEIPDPYEGEPGDPPEVGVSGEDEDEEEDDDDDRDIGDVGDDISTAVSELLKHLDGYERRVEWRDGVPVIQVLNEDGEWEDDPQYDQESAAEIVSEVRKTVSGLEDLDLSEEHTELQKLIDSLAGTGNEEDVKAAYNDAARMLGLDDGTDLQDYMDALVVEMKGGVSGQEGLSEEQMATFRAGNEATIRRDEELMARQLEQVMGERGSSMAYMHAADNARREIRDTRVLAEVDLLQQDMLRQKENYDALKERYQFSVGATADIKAQHMQELIQVRTAAAQEMSNRISLLTDQYQAESSALSSWTQSMYTAMEMDLGLQQHVMDQMDDAYERALRPYLDEIQTLSAEATIKALESQADLTDAQAQAVRDAQARLDQEQQGEDVGNFFTTVGGVLEDIPTIGWLGDAFNLIGKIFG